MLFVAGKGAGLEPHPWCGFLAWMLLVISKDAKTSRQGW
jgi:hypothetical protein